MNQLVISEPGRIRPARWGLVTLMVAVSLTAAGSLLLGGHDALLGYRPNDRLLGVFMLFAGLANMTAMVLLRQGRSGLAALGFTTGSMPGFVLAAARISFDQSPCAAVWLLATVAPGTAAIVTLAHSRPRTGNRPSDTLLAAVVAAVATAAVPLVSLLVGAYRPVTDAQVLNVELDTAVVADRTGGDGARYRVVDICANISNIGRKSLMVIGSRYAVTGYRSEPREIRSQADWRIGEEIAGTRRSSRNEMPSTEALMETSFDFVRPETVLEPGQQTRVNFLATVPAGRTNTIAVTVVLATAFPDRLRMGRETQGLDNQQLSVGHPIHSIHQLVPTGWIAALTRGDMFLKVRYSLFTQADFGYRNNPDTFLDTYLDVTLGHDQRHLDPVKLRSSNMKNFYGAKYTAVNVYLAIDGKR